MCGKLLKRCGIICNVYTVKKLFSLEKKQKSTMYGSALVFN